MGDIDGYPGGRRRQHPKFGPSHPAQKPHLGAQPFELVEQCCEMTERLVVEPILGEQKSKMPQPQHGGVIEARLRLGADGMHEAALLEKNDPLALEVR